MKIAQFKNSYNQTKKLLKDNNLLKQIGNIKYSSSKTFKSISQKDDYLSIYRTAVENYEYDFFLHDESFLQFSFSNNQTKYIRYAYYEYPFDFPQYDKYLRQNDFNPDEVGELFREEYVQALSEAPTKNSFNPIRYEYSITEYKERIHAASHFHIGHKSDIRIPVSILVTPLLFTIFIIKHCQYYSWKEIHNQPNIDKLLKKSKSLCKSVNKEYFSHLDELELYLK